MALIQKAFSDIITFSRSSNATRVGPTGLVEYAPHNLLQRSQEFENAYWSKTASSVTANTTSAPDGTVTADSLIENSAAAQHYLSRNLGTLVGTHTISFYAKANGRNWIAINLVTAADNRTFFNLSTGVVGTNASGNSATITNVGNGWYRCSVSRTLDSATWLVELYLASSDGTLSYTGNGTSGIYIWGAQLSVGPYALDYTPTTSAAVYGPRFDYDGSGVTIVEPVSRNLLTYSEQFDNAAWSKENITITTNSTTAPDGTVTADTFTENTATLEHFTNQQTSKAATNIPYTFSVYVKRATSGTRNVVVAMTDGTTGGYEAVFDPDDGTILIASRGIGVTTGWTPGAATATSAGNGWWRFTFSVTSNTSTRIDGVVYMADGTTKTYTGNGSSNLFVWGAQLEVGSTATAYMVSGATNGFRAVPVVSGSATPKGLLIEEQRTNLCLQSADFTTTWSAANRVSITSNTVVAPDGTLTGDKLIADTTASSTHYVVQNTGSISAPWTFSCYAKAGEYSRVGLSYSNTGYVFFNLSTGVQEGTVGGGITSTSITSVGNGWYRISFTSTSTASGANIGIYLFNGAYSSGVPDFTGDGTSGLYIWGAQAEAGSFATSYIPTLASSVTRSADVASVNTLSPWYNQSEGSFYIEAQMALDTSGNAPSLVSVDDGTVQNHQAVYLISGATHRFAYRIRTSNVSQADFFIDQAGSTAGAIVKLSAAYKVNDFAGDKNGGTVETDTVGTVPTVTNLKIADYVGDSLTANGWYRRIAYYPRRLTNAELQALTA